VNVKHKIKHADNVFCKQRSNKVNTLGEINSNNGVVLNYFFSAMEAPWQAWMAIPVSGQRQKHGASLVEEIAKWLLRFSGDPLPPPSYILQNTLLPPSPPPATAAAVVVFVIAAITVIVPSAVAVAVTVAVAAVVLVSLPPPPPRPPLPLLAFS
jgi:hypothetical protein